MARTQAERGQELQSESSGSEDVSSTVQPPSGDSTPSGRSSSDRDSSSASSEDIADSFNDSNQRQPDPFPHPSRSGKKRLHRKAGATHRRYLPCNAANPMVVTRDTRSLWVARERQFEKFRSSIIVLPIPEGVIRIEKARTYSLHVKSVVNWVIPEPILSTHGVMRSRKILVTSSTNDGCEENESADDESDDQEGVLLTLGVHVSLFHGPSKRFFGNTWVSPEICVDPEQIKPNRDPKSNALRYIVGSVPLNLRAYFVSDIVDSNCFGVVELVAYRKDPDSKATVLAAGCGWSILPLFAQSVAEGANTQPPSTLSTAASSTGESVGVFTGNPRVLWELQNSGEWQSYPRHEQCKFHYQLHLHDPLVALATSGFVRRNELISALEVIPGLKNGNLAGVDAGTNPKLVLMRGSDSGDDDRDVITAYEDALSSYARIASLVPKTIQLQECFTLNIQALRVFMHLRSEVEANLISRLSLSRRTIHNGASSVREGHISARVLKFALHNGRTFRTRQYTVPLKVDDSRGDDVMRCVQASPVRLKGFVFHPYMVVVVSLQFTVQFRVSWPAKLKQQALEAKPMRVLPEDDVTTVTMASRIVAPSDGKKLFLYDKDRLRVDESSTSVDNDRALHVDLLSGPACRPYTDNPMYTPPDHMISAARFDETTSRDSIAFVDLLLSVDGNETSNNTKSNSSVSEASEARPSKAAAEHWAHKILSKADANSILAQTLNALATTAPNPNTVPTVHSPRRSKEERGTSPKRPPSPLKKVPSVKKDPIPSLPQVGQSVTELSRASKALLMRHGFVDAHNMTTVSGNKSETAVDFVRKKEGAKEPKMLRLELEDIYEAHEIRFHFAAFRVTPSSPLTHATIPSRLYFTFQFYNFPPTRTETLRLSNALASSGSSQTYLLMRESPANKPCLAIQYDVDTTVSQNPHENRQFATYLLTKSLYVDVWDADSLFHLGTCAIPLHELLRQGAGVKKFQGEVDVFESFPLTSNLSAQHQHLSDNNATDLDDLDAQSRPMIGKLQILLSNYGLKGRDATKAATSVPKSAAKQTAYPPRATRGKHRVRARPLVDNNAELRKLLVDQGLYNTPGREQRHDVAQSQHHRKLLKSRSEGDATTLTTKEVDVLCELFRVKRGLTSHSTRISCDREGKRGLTALLALKPPLHTVDAPKPSAPVILSTAWPLTAAEDPVTKLRDHLKRVLARAIDKGVHIHQVFMDFDTSGDGSLSYDELGRALRQLGVDHPPGDASANTVLHQLLCQFDADGNGSISYEEFLTWLGIRVTQNRKDIAKIASFDMENSVREVFQRLQTKGIDVEELFDHFDIDKNGSLDMSEFKRALELCLQKELSSSGNQLLAQLNEEALRGLIHRVNKNGDLVVDYHEFLAFCGVELKTPRDDRIKKRSISLAERKLIKLLLRALSKGASVHELFQHFDGNTDGSISIKEFTNVLDALFQTSQSLTEEDIRAITVRFDSNGDGQISFAEFKRFAEEICIAQQQLVALFSPVVDGGVIVRDNGGDLVPVTQWRLTCTKLYNMNSDQLDAMVGWMESVDLVDEKQRVNINDLMLLVNSPSSEQPWPRETDKKEMGIRLRDFLALALAKGVDARRCFAHFDFDGDGEITISELRSALRQLGDQFENVSDDDIDSMARELDVDGSGKISFSEFQHLLRHSELTADSSSSDPSQKSGDVLVWLADLLAAAVNKGMDVGACFDHFDKDKNGTITRSEFVLAMKELTKDGNGGQVFDDTMLAQAMDQIDHDRSGEISLVEFKRLLPAPPSTTHSVKAKALDREELQVQAEETEPAMAQNSKISIERLRDLLASAERGVSIAQSFAHFDIDKDGSLTRDEFSTMLNALPGFEKVESHEMMKVVDVLDANASGNISFEEFEAFVHNQPGPIRAPQLVASEGVEARSDSARATLVATSTSADESETNGDLLLVKDESPLSVPQAVASDADINSPPHSAPNASSSRQSTVVNIGISDLTKGSNPQRLERAGSFSARNECKRNDVKTPARANTDSETVATEASRSRQGVNNPSKTPATASARRPSLAETRAIARKNTIERNAGASTERNEASAAEIGASQGRRTSLAEARAAGKAAKAVAVESSIPPSESTGDDYSKNRSIDTKPDTSSSDVVETTETDPAAPKIEYNSSQAGGGADVTGIDVVEPTVVTARRPSLAEARAAGRMAGKIGSSVASGKPRVGSGVRRQSLSQTRAPTAPTAVQAPPGEPEMPQPQSAQEIHDSLLNLRTLLSNAQANGVDLRTALAHFDKDENGKLSYTEFCDGLKGLGRIFTGVSPEAAMRMAKCIDLGQKGFITQQDFQVFVQTPMCARPSSEEAQPGQPTPSVATASTDSTTIKPPAHRLSRGTSLTARSSKPANSTRSAMSESEAMGAPTGVAGKLSAQRTEKPLNSAEGRPELPYTPAAAPTLPAEGSHPSSASLSNSSPAQFDYEYTYEFHSDPVIRSVEVKLRRAAIDAYSRGVFPLRIIQRFLESSSRNSTSSTTNKSELRRVEFLQVLMELGFSLLSDSNEDDDESYEPNSASRGPKMHDQLYARQLERLARYKHHTKQESRAEKALARAVQQTQLRAHKHSKKPASSSGERPPNSITRFVNDKSQLLRVLSYYRDGHKKSLVYSLLRDQVTTHAALFPSFAALLFAELAFANPYPHQERFRLEFLAVPTAVDADIVKSSDEWRFYRRHVPLSYGEGPFSASSVDDVEHDMVDPENEVVLDGNDQIAIPIKLRWLEPSTTTKSTKAPATMSLAVRSCTHGHTVALFKMELFAQSFACHRVLRFVHPANSVWKWTVSCPPGKHFVCLDPSVAAVSESSASGDTTLVSLKCRVGSYPSLEDFYVVIYDDEYFARIDEVWQIRVQSAMRLDVHTLLGQTVRSELVIRGDAAGPRARHVRCFTTWHHANFVSFRPSQIFQLAGDAYNRIEWRFCAAEMPAPPVCRVRVHLVDVNSLELVGSWLLYISLASPSITKSYELTLPLAQPAQKKIAYSNPWDQPQTIVLRSSDPARMRPRDSVLQIPPHGQIFLRLVFPAPATTQRDESELLLFVNDQQTEQSEECLRFQVSYN